MSATEHTRSHPTLLDGESRWVVLQYFVANASRGTSLREGQKNACKVIAGTFGPDTDAATTIRFVYGGGSEVDIDHVVALADVRGMGGHLVGDDSGLDVVAVRQAEVFLGRT
jgi:hypothetical protein